MTFTKIFNKWLIKNTTYQRRITYASFLFVLFDFLSLIFGKNSHWLKPCYAGTHYKYLIVGTELRHDLMVIFGCRCMSIVLATEWCARLGIQRDFLIVWMIVQWVALPRNECCCNLSCGDWKVRRSSIMKIVHWIRHNAWDGRRNKTKIFHKVSSNLKRLSWVCLKQNKNHFTRRAKKIMRKPREISKCRMAASYRENSPVSES